MRAMISRSSPKKTPTDVTTSRDPEGRVFLCMATLEVHDGQGRVQFVELARDHPVLFGTSAACDVLLEGDGIRPVHGRIRWKETVQVEASPDAEFVLINGTKMTTGSIHQGDEIAVGDCRMFLLRADEDLEPATRSKSPAEDDRTRVAAAPVVRMGEARPGTMRGAREADPPLLENAPIGSTSLRSTRAGARIASLDAPLAEVFARGRQDEHAARRAPAQAQTKPAAGSAWARLISSLGHRWLRAGSGSLSSPLVLGLVASLAVLVGMGFWLKAIIASTIATRTFNRGVQDYDDGDYRTAIRDFDTFVTTNPDDPRAGKAKVSAGDGQCPAVRPDRGGNLVVGARGVPGDARAGGTAPGISRRAGRPGRADHQDRRGPGRSRAAHRRRRRRWPRPSRSSPARPVAGEPALTF